VKHSKPSAKYLTSLQKRYRQADRAARGQMLDEFVATSHYHRKYAMGLLRGRVQPRAHRPRQRAAPRRGREQAAKRRAGQGGRDRQQRGQQ